jgi:N-ethylmaleimide reductase
LRGDALLSRHTPPTDAGPASFLRAGYLHVIEPRIKGPEEIVEGQDPIAAEHLRKIFKCPIIAAGGFTPKTAGAVVAKGDADAVAFGRFFVSNPDLPARIRNDAPLASYDRSTFFTFDPEGHVDYPAPVAVA